MTKDIKKDLPTIIAGLALFALFAMILLWWRDVAIKEEIVYQPQIITVVDTTTAENIEAMWMETVKSIIDSFAALEPDTIYLAEKIISSEPDTVYLSAGIASPWQEKILRLVYKPPALSFTTENDTLKIKRYIYSDIPWGFIIYPDDKGEMLIQNIEPPPIPILRGGYNWGIGTSWSWFGGAVPALFGEYYLKRKQTAFTGLVQISASGANLGLYLRWK